jgi:NDP-sugar pyrophosphorylase family protein
MPSADLAALVLAAGEGSRLRPLTAIRPKPLCPVDNVALLDSALDEATSLLGRSGPDFVAVNAHHLADQIAAHVEGRTHLSREEPVALGTAGAVGAVREWLDNRHVLVRNADAWRASRTDATFVADWDRNRVRLLVVEDTQRADFGGRWRYAGLCLLPAALAQALRVVPSGLYEELWARAEADGQLDLVVSDIPFVDCGTPASYLEANLLASGGRSVVGNGATVEGELTRSVVWPGGAVQADEHLVDSIRVGTALTVVAHH